MRKAACLALAFALVLITGPGRADGTRGEAALAKARAALARGDGIAARTELGRAQAAGIGADVLAPAMGEALIIEGDYSGARHWLAPGRFAKGQEGYGWRMLGMLERFSGDFDAAAAAYGRALTFAPNDPLIWADLGRLRYSTGDQIGAIAAADRALVADPDNPRALELRAQLLRDQAGSGAALPLYERALVKAPDDMALLAGYAATLGEAGRMHDMVTVTRHMIDLDPSDSRPWLYQAVLAARAGNVPLARKLLTRAGPSAVNSPAATLLLGILELEAGNANVAATQFDALLQRQPANEPAALLLARALYEAGEADAVVGRFAALASRPQAPAYLLTLVGRALEEKGDRAAAAVYLDRAALAKAVPLTPVAVGGGGDAAATVRSLLADGNFAAAAASGESYAKAHPGMFEALALAGDAALAANRPADALGYYRRAAQVRFPERMLLRTVEALEKAGRGSEAPSLVGSYLRSWPNSRIAMRLAAGYAARGGDWGRSRTLLERLATTTGGARDVRVLADLSLARLNTGDADVALDSAMSAARFEPDNGVAAQAWAMALIELDQDREPTRQLIDKIERIDGDSPTLSAMRARIGK